MQIYLKGKSSRIPYLTRTHRRQCKESREYCVNYLQDSVSLLSFYTLWTIPLDQRRDIFTECSKHFPGRSSYCLGTQTEQTVLLDFFLRKRTSKSEAPPLLRTKFFIQKEGMALSLIKMLSILLLPFNFTRWKQVK